MVNNEEEVRRQLKIMRNLTTQLRESTEQQVDSEDFNAERKSFSDAIPALCNFETFKKQDSNVIFGGVIKAGQEIKWRFSIETPDSIFITSQSLQLDDKAMSLIGALKSYYTIWYDKWVKTFSGGDDTSSVGMGSGNPVDTTNPDQSDNGGGMGGL
jgi:hypothetical protein